VSCLLAGIGAEQCDARKRMPEKNLVITEVCAALKNGFRDQAVTVLKRNYPFAPNPITKRKYGALESTRLWVRDGFIDRYTAERLVFPPVLRIISAELPDEFPFHKNWRTEVTHPAYWELAATVDHLVPVSRGGADNESNWVTTTMARNSAKRNWTLAELGWALQPPGKFQDWDGLMHWFVDYTDSRPQLLTYASIRQWRRAALAVLTDNTRSTCR
jgi:hypothetical protein